MNFDTSVSTSVTSGVTAFLWILWMKKSVVSCSGQMMRDAAGMTEMETVMITGVLSNTTLSAQYGDEHALSAVYG